MCINANGTTHMTISLLRRLPTQQIARPVNRACSRDELRELVGWFAEAMTSVTNGRRAMGWYNVQAIDTDEPILTLLDTKGLVVATFYAFTEE